MPKGRVLTPEEREEIARMHDAGASGREIAKKIARSKTVVLNFLKNPAQYAQTKRSGRKRALSGDDERRLYAALFQKHSDADRNTDGSSAILTDDTSGAVDQSEGLQQRATLSPSHQIKKSAEQIRKEFNVPLSTRRVQQLLSEWRRQARKAQDNQQQLMTPGDAVVDQGSKERDTNSNSSEGRQSDDGHDGPERVADPGQTETFSEGFGCGSATVEGDKECHDLQHAITTTEVVSEETLAGGNITSSTEEAAAESPRRSTEAASSPPPPPASMEV
uniref:Transposase IS30-like HTH domain-containing protein n=1 Tax=Globisporangium ultimum (strain ATCC 200006 / CBS 805.95 / DAOM BR144) TaxID=431595 RepID=K3X308_GLOUD